MEALHIVPQNPTENIEETAVSESSFKKAQIQLNSYLADLRETKDKSAFEVHEAVIVRLVTALGQAALQDALSHYDITCDIISVGEQTYRHKHKAATTYQSYFARASYLATHSSSRWRTG